MNWLAVVGGLEIMILNLSDSKINEQLIKKVFLTVDLEGTSRE